MQVQKTRNYFGLLGALLALLGFFCPFANAEHSWIYANAVMEHDFGAYIESLRTFSQHSTPFFAAYVILLAAAGIAFLFACHKTGLFLTLVPTAFFLLIALQRGPALIAVAGIGFWLSMVGLAAMLLACSMIGLNQKLLPFSVFYCQKPQSTVYKMQRVSRSRTAKAYLYEKRGYAGIVGALMVLIGFFLPYLSAFGQSISLFDYFRSAFHPIIVCGYIFFLIDIVIGYFLRCHAISCTLSLPYAVYYIFCIVSEVGILKVGQIGFWLTIIGIVLMVLSPAISKSMPAPLGCAAASTPRTTPVAVPDSGFGFVGIAGSVITLIGFFVPFLSDWLFSFSLCEFISSEVSPVLTAVYIILLLAVCAAYLLRRHTLGCVLSIPYACALLYEVITEPQMFEAGAAGFWLTLIGIVLMLISPVITIKLPAKQS